MLESEIRAGLTIKPLEGADFGAEVIGLEPHQFCTNFLNGLLLPHKRTMIVLFGGGCCF